MALRGLSIGQLTLLALLIWIFILIGIPVTAVSTGLPSSVSFQIDNVQASFCHGHLEKVFT